MLIRDALYRDELMMLLNVVALAQCVVKVAIVVSA